MLATSVLILILPIVFLAVVWGFVLKYRYQFYKSSTRFESTSNSYPARLIRLSSFFLGLARTTGELRLTESGVVFKRLPLVPNDIVLGRAITISYTDIQSAQLWGGKGVIITKKNGTEYKFRIKKNRDVFYQDLSKRLAKA